MEKKERKEKREERKKKSEHNFSKEPIETGFFAILPKNIGPNWPVERHLGVKRY